MLAVGTIIWKRTFDKDILIHIKHNSTQDPVMIDGLSHRVLLMVYNSRVIYHSNMTSFRFVNKQAMYYLQNLIDTCVVHKIKPDNKITQYNYLNCCLRSKTYFSHYYGVLTPLNQWWKNLSSSRGLKCLVPFPARPTT